MYRGTYGCCSFIGPLSTNQAKSSLGKKRSHTWRFWFKLAFSATSSEAVGVSDAPVACVCSPPPHIPVHAAVTDFPHCANACALDFMFLIFTLLTKTSRVLWIQYFKMRKQLLKPFEGISQIASAVRRKASVQPLYSNLWVRSKSPHC